VTQRRCGYCCPVPLLARPRFIAHDGEQLIASRGLGRSWWQFPQSHEAMQIVGVHRSYPVFGARGFSTSNHVATPAFVTPSRRLPPLHFPSVVAR
jgi:hypothetical protein